jgi:putative CocE/NonD family hydrolase
VSIISIVRMACCGWLLTGADLGYSQQIPNIPEGAAVDPVRAGRETPYEVASTKHVMVAMRDGVRLATDIYRPARNGTPVDGKFPVLVERTPYNKESQDPNSGITSNDLIRRAHGLANGSVSFVASGYVVVIQDVRGRYRSEGHWRPLVDDGNDGFDTASWILGQPWANGKIGALGVSYEGGTQHALAMANAPGLSTLIPVDAMSNFGLFGIRHNGAFELRWFNWVFTMIGNPKMPDVALAAKHAASDPAAVDSLLALGSRVREYVRELPLRPGATPLKFAPDYEAWLVEAMSHGDYDAFWKNNSVNVIDHLADYKDIPVLHFTGWYDSWGAPVANLNYVGLRKTKKSLQRLVIGPWTHGGQSINAAGEAQFTADAALDMRQFRLRWYDHWLKGIDNGVDREAPVRIYVMGGGGGHKTPEGRLFVGGHWRNEQEWPLARTMPTPYYLHASGVLSPGLPRDEQPIAYTFDPRNPVPSIGGPVSSQGDLMSPGAADQRCRQDFWLCSDSKPLSARSDVVVFQTAPLTEDVEVTGRLIVKLWAASNALDTDFTAKLVDVYPPNTDFPAGVDLNIADGIVRARYRDNLAKAELLQPGKPYEFTIEMYPTSLVFQRGHRIRLDISSSNFPRFDVNPNTGEPLNNNRRWQVARNTIYCDALHPSRIVLPVIPRSTANQALR